MSEHFQKLFETDPLSIELVSDVTQSLVDVLVSLVVTESLSSGNDFSHVGLSSVVCIEIEESVEVFDLLLVEGGVAGDDWLGPEFLALLFDNFLLVNRCH